MLSYHVLAFSNLIIFFSIDLRYSRGNIVSGLSSSIVLHFPCYILIRHFCCVLSVSTRIVLVSLIRIIGIFWGTLLLIVSRILFRHFKMYRLDYILVSFKSFFFGLYLMIYLFILLFRVLYFFSFFLWQNFSVFFSLTLLVCCCYFLIRLFSLVY